MLYLSDYIPALRYGAQIDIGQNTDLDASSSLAITSYMSTAIASMPISVSAYPSIVTAGARGGAVNISLNRLSTFPLTSWDGNPDTGLKMSVYNSAINGTNGGTRGLDIGVRNQGTGSTESWINGMTMIAENKTGAGTIVSSIVAQFNIKNNGVVSTSNYGVVIQDESQGTNPTATAMLRFTTSTINPASGAVPAAINIASKNTAGITNLIYAESETLDCATIGAGTYSTADGYFTIKVGANTYRIPFFTAVDD